MIIKITAESMNKNNGACCTYFIISFVLKEEL